MSEGLTQKTELILRDQINGCTTCDTANSVGLTPSTETTDVRLVTAGETVTPPFANRLRQLADHTGPHVRIGKEGYIVHTYVAFVVFVITHSPNGIWAF